MQPLVLTSPVTDFEERGCDYYPTPAWCVRRLLEAVDLPGGRWLGAADERRAFFIVDLWAAVRAGVDVARA